MPSRGSLSCRLCTASDDESGHHRRGPPNRVPTPPPTASRDTIVGMSGRRPIRATDLAEEIGKSRPFEHPAQEAYLNLVRTRSVLSEHFASVFRGAGVTEVQYNVLRILDAAGEDGVRLESIRDHLLERGPDISRLVDRLEARGFVLRTTDEADRRVRRVSIDDEGRTLLATLRPKIDRIHRDHLDHLSAEDLEALNRLLFKARHRESG